MKKQEKKFLTRIIAVMEEIYEDSLFVYEVSRDEDGGFEAEFKGIYEERK